MWVCAGAAAVVSAPGDIDMSTWVQLGVDSMSIWDCHLGRLVGLHQYESGDC